MTTNNRNRNRSPKVETPKVETPKVETTPLDKGGKDGVELWGGTPPLWEQKYAPQAGEMVIKAKKALVTLCDKSQDYGTKLVPYCGAHIQILDVNSLAGFEGVKVSKPEEKLALRDAILTVLVSWKHPHHDDPYREKKQGKLKEVLSRFQGVEYTPNHSWTTSSGGLTPKGEEFFRRWNVECSGDSKRVSSLYGKDEWNRPNLTPAAAYAVYKKLRDSGHQMVPPPDKRGKPKSEASTKVLAEIEGL